MGPVVAPAGTSAWIEVSESTLPAVTGTPLKVTEVAPAKWVPVIVTTVPTGPLVGVKLVIVGVADAAVTVKLVLLVAVPFEVVTLIGPVVAPLGTSAWIEVSESMLPAVTGTPLKVTEVAPAKWVPVIVTTVPTGPLVGVKLVIVGVADAAVTVKLVLLVAVPPGVVTLIRPVVAPLGTVAVIEAEEPTVKLALAPLKRTAVAPAKFVPLIATVVPAGPLVGEKPEIEGGLAATVKVPLLVAVPPGVVTLIRPVVAPLGTVAVIEAEEPTVKLALAPFEAHRRRAGEVRAADRDRGPRGAAGR